MKTGSESLDISKLPTYTEEMFEPRRVMQFENKMVICSEFQDKNTHRKTILEIKKPPQDHCPDCYGRGWREYNRTMNYFVLCDCVKDETPIFVPMEN